MPELPEIETLSRELKDRIVGKAIADVDCSQPKMINLTLQDYRQRVHGPIVGAARRAKSAILTLEQGNLWLHLGLRGEARYFPSGAQAPTASITFHLEDRARLALIGVFMGHAHFWSPEEHQSRWNQFGIDPLEPDFSLHAFRAVLQSKPRLDVKGLLMEQTLIAGIGNTYSDEILLAARLHPARTADSLADEESERLHTFVVSVLKEAVRLGGESSYVDLDGTHGRYQPSIHGRDRCPVCGGSTQVAKFRGRTAYFCPQCQAR
ncbi:MAG: Fpg/Nei family DNA glycosylase [Chloroflexota bacterium]|nr:MAG: Fpg/Nei family DNA glycosylase [Chloroflexota bacterium]